MRKIMLTALAVAAFLPVARAGAQPPVLGNYASSDLGGAMLQGHFSESWQSPEGGDEVGNTIHMESWNKAELGTQWRVWCAFLASQPQLIDDSVDAKGNGHRIWRADYVGGHLWLDGAPPWGGGDTEYSGNIDTYTRFLRIDYELGKPVKDSCEISINGHLLQYPEICFTFDAHCLVAGDTAKDKKLDLDYPPFMDNSCQEGPVDGWWGLVYNIRLSLSGCTTPVLKRTWGSIKSLYGD